jgi:GrpB-like predicted nucleotidyltransferase (UPF0157 family)
MPFGGIKVFDLPVRVISATDGSTGHYATYGIACAGSYLNMFLVKELVAEVVAHLQIAGTQEEISFEKICELVSKFHDHLFQQTSTQLGFPSEMDFFLGGVCPQAQSVKVARFWTRENPREARWAETLLNPAPVAVDTIGNPDACDRFNALLKLNLDAGSCRVHFAIYRRLLDVINDPAFPSVAGAIQHGDFDGSGRFHLYGSFQHQIENGQMAAKTYVRGTNIESVHQPSQLGELFVNYSYLDPFGEDVQSYKSDSFTTDEGGLRFLDERITLLPFDEKWSEHFAEEAEFLKQILGSSLLGLEHIGSTAVQNMAALPVIDIIVGILRLEQSRSGPFNLSSFRYEYLGDAGLPGRLLYRKRGEKAFNLHVVEMSGTFWNQGLMLRQFLREHTNAARDFSLQKARILNTGSWTLLRYLDARAGYFGTLLERAAQNG